MKNIFFIDRFPFNKEFFLRHEFELLSSKGHDTKFLNISKFLKKQELESTLPSNLKQYEISFNSKKEFISFITKEASNSIIITTVPFIASSAWMYIHFFKLKLEYILLQNESFPEFEQKKPKKDRLEKINRSLKKLSVQSILQKPLDNTLFLQCKASIHPAKMIITSKVDGKTSLNKLANKDTIIRYSFSPDYKMALSIPDDRLISEKYAVFIDQYFCHHPDFKTNSVIHKFSATDYYPRINKFLHSFSKSTGLKVVIASHPRRNKVQAKDFDQEFELFYNKTAGLIKNSELVLMHFSTAISFSVIFKKPFLLLKSELFEFGTIQKKINGFAKYFQMNQENIDNEFDANARDITSFNKTIYRTYENSFLKHPKAKHETFGEKILSYLNK